MEHDGLPLHAPDHVEGRAGTAAQCHFEHVVADALLEGLAQLVLDFEKAVGRTQSADPLVGPLVIVVLDPQPDPDACLLEVVELGAGEELAPDAAPEALDLAEGHRVLRLRADVGHPVLLHLLLEAAGAAPGGILPAVVGEHFAGHAVFADGPAVELDDGLGGLAAEQLGSGDEARVVVEVGDQIGVATAEPEGEDVALPHLVGRGPLETPRLGGVAAGLAARFLDEIFFIERPADGLGAGLHEEPAAQHLGDAPHPPAGVGLLEVDDLAAHRGWQAPARFAAARGRRRSAQQGRLGAFPAIG
jgi:hypothetical protein